MRSVPNWTVSRVGCRRGDAGARTTSALINTHEWRPPMAMAFAVSLLSAATEAQPVSVLRLDFVREMTDGDGNRTVVERGRHFIADGGEYRMDKVSNGERISEIRLPAAGERFVVNHDLRLAVRGPLDGNWPVPASRALTVRPVTPAPPVMPSPPGAGRPHPGRLRFATPPVDSLGERVIGTLIATLIATQPRGESRPFRAFGELT